MTGSIGASRGLTLVEVVIAVVMSTMILLGMYTIFASAFRFQTETQRIDAVRGDMVLSLKALTRDLEAATFIFEPTAPCSGAQSVCAPGTPGVTNQTSDRLIGYLNSDPSLREANGTLSRLDGSDVNDDARDPGWFQYCVVAERLCRVAQSANTAPFPPTVFADCCAQAGAVVVAQGVVSAGTPFFTRPAYNNNVVELHYIVQQTPAGTNAARSYVYTAITTRTSRTGGQ